MHTSGRGSRHAQTGGFSLIEALVAIGVLAALFAALASVLQLSLITVDRSNASAGARALATERIERIRGMAYTKVGTQGGIPDGPLVQEEQIDRNGITYTRRTFVRYVDDDADGEGTNDANGVTSDYKTVKVSVSWARRGQPGSIASVTNIVPPGIETTDGGGTLRLRVFDAGGQPVSDAAVRLQNDGTSPPVDVTSYTNDSGSVLFPGAPTTSKYAVTATKAGFSTAQTYAVTNDNPNPAPGHINVVAGETTSASFAIDEISQLTIDTDERYTDTAFSDTFTDADAVASSTDVAVGGGTVTLEQQSGTYATRGTVRGVGVNPVYLQAWDALSFQDATTASTSVAIRVFHRRNGQWQPVPASDLAGNDAGFQSSPVDISGLATDTYRELALFGRLETEAASTTPSLETWTLSYTGGPEPRPDTDVSVRLNKTIGEEDNGDPIYKFTDTITTSATGTRTLSGLEWGSYSLTLPASDTFDIAAGCPGLPLSLQPNTAETARLVLADDAAHTLRVIVTDSSGNPLNNAQVTVERNTYRRERATVLCGQAFFVVPDAGTQQAGDPYSVTVAADGYATSTDSAVDVDGDETYTVLLNTL